MFDTMKIAKRIKEERIAQNLTQMNLADAMGVSYQAVSNWERGNSMPDISKLEDLCRVLKISVNSLLGMEDEKTSAVEKVLQKEDAVLTAEELAEIAPLLPPAEVKTQVKKQKRNVAALVGIAPYLEEDFLKELVENIEVESLLALQSLAPYLEEDTLDKLARRAPKDDFNGISALAPFLSEETLDFLVKRSEQKPEDEAFLETLLPFLEDDTLEWLVEKWGEDLDSAMLEKMAPFLDDDILEELAQKQIDRGNAAKLGKLLPFMEDDTVRKVVKALMMEGDMEAVKEAARYL